MPASELLRRAKLPKWNFALIVRAHRIHKRYHIPFGLAHLAVDWPRRAYNAIQWLWSATASEWRLLVATLATLCTPLTLVLLNTCGGS